MVIKGNNIWSFCTVCHLKANIWLWPPKHLQTSFPILWKRLKFEVYATIFQVLQFFQTFGQTKVTVSLYILKKNWDISMTTRVNWSNKDWCTNQVAAMICIIRIQTKTVWDMVISKSDFKPLVTAVFLWQEVEDNLIKNKSYFDL